MRAGSLAPVQTPPEGVRPDADARGWDGAWSAPGRLNLIGEHTDYTGGLALPMALAERAVVRARARDDDRLVVTSAGHGTAELATRPRPGSVRGWPAYVAGVAWALGEAGHAVPGADLEITSDVPAGAGLASSHALEVAVALALTGLAGRALDEDLDRRDLARLVQRAEQEFVGAPTGLLDQLAALFATEGHAVLLDTRSLAAEAVPLALADAGLALLVVDTRVAHAHTDGGYAARRDACLAAEAALGVGLRDLADGGDPVADVLAPLDDAVQRRRARHVVTENRRVRQAVAALRAQDPRLLGPLLTASHASLRDDHEVSTPELDGAVEAAVTAGALGARMVGGGFGGSAVALVPVGAREAVAESVRRRAAGAGWPEPAVRVATPSPGARRDA